MKKWTKSIALLLIFALLLPMLTACSGGGLEGLLQWLEQFEDKPTEPGGNTSMTGTVEDRTYKNQFFDLSLTLPEHWYFDSLENEPLTFFSERTEEETAETAFFVDCRAMNPVTGDAIEITVERIPDTIYYASERHLYMWESRGGQFNNIPDGFQGGGETGCQIGPNIYSGRRYVLQNGYGELVGRAAFYYFEKEQYVICITLIADGFFGEDGLKGHAIGRLIGWFGTASEPSTVTQAPGGGYYLNEVMAPAMESTIYYSGYRRNEPFTITGVPFYDCIPMDNGQGHGNGRQADAVYYLDGKTYSHISFTVGLMDHMIRSNTYPEDKAALEILVDGRQIWEEYFHAFDAPRTFTVDISGARTVIFRIRQSWELTGLAFADPVLYTSEPKLDATITPVTETVDFFAGAVQFYCDNGVTVLDGSSRDSFTVMGKSYNKGILLRDNRQFDSGVWFNLGGKYEQFNFSVGIIQESIYQNDGWLNIYLDGVKILDIPLLDENPTESYSLNVSGGHILRIEGSYGTEGALHQADYALFNMTLGAPNIEVPEQVAPGSYKLISEIGIPFSTKGTQVYDGSTKYRGHYMGDVFYNEGIAMTSIYHIFTPIDSAVPAEANFALGGQFKYLTFTVGRVDRSHVKNDTLVVMGDGKELARFALTATDFPASYQVEVEGVEVLQFLLLGAPMLTRGTYMVADIAVHTDEVKPVEFFKHPEEPFPPVVDLMERFQPYEYMSAEGNGHDAVRYFNGIYDGTDNREYFTIDGQKHTRGFVLSTSVYLSLEGVAGMAGASFMNFFIIGALATSGSVSQASFASFNLHGQYQTLTFNIGVVDGQNENDTRNQPYDTLYIFADEEIVGQYTLTGDMATMEITVDVANCERLVFWLDHNYNSYSYGIFDATVSQ